MDRRPTVDRVRKPVPTRRTEGDPRAGTDKPLAGARIAMLQRALGNAGLARLLSPSAQAAPRSAVARQAARRRARTRLTRPEDVSDSTAAPESFATAPAEGELSEPELGFAPFESAAAGAGDGMPSIQRQDEDEDANSEVAEEIYDSLNWGNEVSRAMAALRRAHSMGSGVQSAFESEYGSLREYLIDQLSTEEAIEAVATLAHGHAHDLQVGLARAILPSGTRDAEIHRILGSVPVANRAALADAYYNDFWDMGEGTLRDDLIGDQSGWELEKSLSLLDHEMTEAEMLYFDSVAITGTHTDSVIQRLQRIAAANDPNAFAKLEQEWNDFVKSSAGWNTPPPEAFTSMDIRAAMDSELSGEEAGFALTAIDQARHRGENAAGALPAEAAAATPGAVAMTEEQLVADEDLRLEMQKGFLRSAAEGAGTNEDQMYAAVEAIRGIWNTRISRADAAGNADLLARYRSGWEADQNWMRPIVNDEMDEEGLENLRVRLLLSGPLEPVDEFYLATEDYDDDKAVEIITRTWAQGKIDALINAARTPKLDAEGKTLRPTYDPILAMRVTSGTPFVRTAVLMNSSHSDVERGAYRLKTELDEGSADSDCQKALQFLKTPGIDTGRRDQIISTFVSIQGLAGREEPSDIKKFLGWIGERYEQSTATWDMRDYLDPAATPEDMLTRAEGRHDAAHSGIMDSVATDFARDWGHLTGEDTVEVEQEALENLRFVVSSATPDELQALLALTGKTSINELAQFEYDEYKSRLDELRALKATIAEGLATAVELLAAAALTVATGGAASGALAVAIGSAISGMVARELLLGSEYELTSEENAKQLIIVAATAGVGSALGPALSEMQALQRLGRAGGFIAGALTEGAKSLTAQTLQAALSEHPLTEDAFADMVIRSVGSTLAGGVSGGMTFRVSDLPIGERFLPTIQAQIVGNLVSGTSDEVAAFTGQGNMTAGDLIARLATRSTRSVGEGSVSGTADVVAQAVAAYRASRSGGGGDNTTPAPNAAGGEDEDTIPNAPAADEENAVPSAPAGDREEGGGGGGRRPPGGGGPGGEGGGGEGGGGRMFTDEEIDTLLQPLVDQETVARLNEEVRQLVAGRGVGEPLEAPALARSDAEVALARRILSNPNSPPEAVNQALQVVVERAVADFRALHLQEGGSGQGQGLDADNLRGMCGGGRDVTADSIASLTVGTNVPLVVHRMQAAHLGIDARHAFTVIIMPDGSGFIVDPTFAQFADQVTGRTYTAEHMLADPRAVTAARDLLRDGFMPLTPENAHDYALGLGATPDEAAAVAARIAAGDASILTEVVANGTVTRASNRPGEAFNTLVLPQDIGDGGAGTIASITDILDRLPPDDPARPQLASLRDRLLMIWAQQQEVTPTGIGTRPGG